MATAIQVAAKKAGKTKQPPPAPPATPVSAYPNYSDGPGYPTAPAATPVTGDPGALWNGQSGGGSSGGGSLGTNSGGYVAGSGDAGGGLPSGGALDFEAWKNGNYAGQDSTYTAETASADAEFKKLIDQLTRQNSDFQTDFKGSLKGLGLNWQGDDFKNGSWNPDDVLGAYGQSYQNLQNDFSGRGLMDSTFYGGAQRDLNDRFDRQRQDMYSQYDRSQADYQAQQTAAQEAQKAARDRALVEAYSRYMAGLAI